MESFGGLAQLGEHLLCKQGVIGSNPLSSTKTRPGGEMVYTGDLKSPVERHAGSSPAPGTKYNSLIAQLVRASS